MKVVSIFIKGERINNGKKLFENAEIGTEAIWTISRPKQNYERFTAYVYPDDKKYF